VDADLDTLATALHVRTDDLLKVAPEHAPARPRVGIAPRLTDAEPVTLAVMQAPLGRTSETRWLRFAHAQLRHLFPLPAAAARLQQAAARPGRDLSNGAGPDQQSRRRGHKAALGDSGLCVRCCVSAAA
jgi:hypothetical protein